MLWCWYGSHCCFRHSDVMVVMFTSVLLFGGCYCLVVGVVCGGGCGLTEEERSAIRKPPSQWKESDLDIVLSEPTERWEGPLSPQGGDSNSESRRNH